jgi:hypothetical protein
MDIILNRRAPSSYEFEVIKSALLKHEELHGNMLVDHSFVVPMESNDWPSETWGMLLGWLVSDILCDPLYKGYRDNLFHLWFGLEGDIDVTKNSTGSSLNPVDNISSLNPMDPGLVSNKKSRPFICDIMDIELSQILSEPPLLSSSRTSSILNLQNNIPDICQMVSTQSGDNPVSEVKRRKRKTQKTDDIGNVRLERKEIHSDVNTEESNIIVKIVAEVAFAVTE